MQIIPNEGLDTIKLGTNLYTIINQFKHESVSINYSQKDYLNAPIRLKLNKYGINLIFVHDELKLIELIDLNQGYNYNGVKLLHNFSLKTIYNKIFGPTYPGKLVDSNYILSYPGISFKFTDIDNDSLSELLNGKEDYQCKEILIFQNNYEDIFKPLKPNISSGSSNNDIPLSSSVVSGSTASTESEPTKSFKIQINIKLGIMKFILHDKEYLIKIGETNQQDILNFLGPPNDYFNKFDSRLLIHNNFCKKFNIELNKIYKFHNYFQYGLDILYDLNNGKVTKLILHNGNLIESNSFGHWNKCNYEIYLGVDSNIDRPFNPYDMKVTSHYYFNQIPSEFFDGEPDKVPILLNRSESELINNLDVVPINDNNWGQSKLYCYKNCIWEVLNNNCVSCVTIY